MSCEPAALGRLSREYVLNPITALAFYTSFTDGQQYLLAGEDTDIKVYHVRTSRMCGQVPIFRAQSIHGIAVPPANASSRPQLILIWGGQSVKVLPGDIIEHFISGRSNEQSLIKDAIESKAPDWIFDGRVSPFKDNRIVLLTAHNEVIQAHVDPIRSSLVFVSIQSPSRPILYSGNFFWVSETCVLVAAGTVFGEIIYWKCHLDASKQEQNCEVLFIFTGHEGSIFGVHISPEIRNTKGESIRLLASCSDDRTIRVWDITESSEKIKLQRQNGYESHTLDARETGFGKNTETTADDDNLTRCVATVMGHASRIWQVEFAPDQILSESSDNVELYSFGEDATVQKWNLTLTSQLSNQNRAAKLTHRSTFSNHSGKHIWSHAVIPDGNDLLIATGGADGKVSLIGAGMNHFLPKTKDGSQVNPRDKALDISKTTIWNLQDVLQSSKLNKPVTTVQETLGNSPNNLTSPSQSGKSKNAKEGFSRYTFISDNRLLAATNSGRIFVGSFEEDLTWTELNVPDELGQVVFSHALLGKSQANPMALVGTNTGDLYHYTWSEGHSLRRLTKIDGNIADIFCLLSDGNHLEFLVTLLQSTQAAIIKLDLNSLTDKHVGVALEPGFMVTAAAFDKDRLILGSRKGIIAVLEQDEGGRYSANFTTEIHKGEAITSISPIQNQDDQPHNYILNTCRDGKYRIHEIITTASQAGAVLIHEILPPFVSSVEGAWLSGNDNSSKDIMLCGFRSNKFVVWDETQRHEVASIDCGGSSRRFAWTPIKDQPDGFRFVFTKAGQMHIFSQTIAPHMTLKSGGHGREIKAISASSGKYIATAAEDTVIRIWGYQGGTSGLRCITALEKHAAGIQALKWYKDEYLFSSAGNEEFFVWKLNQLDSNDFGGVAVVCEAVFPDRTEVGDARITDFDISCVESDGHSTHEFIISMVLSNSTLQTYSYTKQAGFCLRRRWTYTGACLTQVRHLSGGHILTAATDGHIAIYTNTDHEAEIESDSAPSLTTKLHQNTIKSLDIRQVTTSDDETSLEYIITTSGDDNALGFIHLSLPSSSAQTDSLKPAVKNKSIIRSANAAAITGVAIANLEENAVVVATCSNDQRVRIWRLVGWQEQDSRLRAQLLDERYSSVADAGDLEILEDGGEDETKGKKKVIVVGVGIEVWELAV
ncbi:hypothetical protein M426DRAFT_320848 [Hypoxylon sp. CI-4A]|nr:hypothetical protein M426DRAFT_320848 [Hypoxylon sp. CI-4A]